MADRMLTIAIDGPAASGKSTVARQVAAALGYTYIDTGAMYRALALASLRQGVSPADEAALARLLAAIDIRLGPGSSGRPSVWLDGEDVTAAIRDSAVDDVVSKVAQHPAVRERFVELQQRLAAGGGVVMDGRDIGTTVLPHADVKVFLTASLEERTCRRLADLAARGSIVPAAELAEALAQRDRQDRERQHAPLTQAADAVVIDSTGQSADDVVAAILALCRAAAAADASAQKKDARLTSVPKQG